jgi:hypothetical protein
VAEEGQEVRHTGKVQGALAFAIVAGFFVTLYMLTKVDVASGMRDALLIMVGALGAGLGNVLNYYFGSSSGSQSKDRLLAEKEPG